MSTPPPDVLFKVFSQYFFLAVDVKKKKRLTSNDQTPFSLFLTPQCAFDLLWQRARPNLRAHAVTNPPPAPCTYTLNLKVSPQIALLAPTRPAPPIPPNLDLLSFAKPTRGQSASSLALRTEWSRHKIASLVRRNVTTSGGREPLDHGRLRKASTWADLGRHT